MALRSTRPALPLGRVGRFEPAARDLWPHLRSVMNVAVRGGTFAPVKPGAPTAIGGKAAPYLRINRRYGNYRVFRAFSCSFETNLALNPVAKSGWAHAP
jgi:hypothetical protein